MLTGPIGEELKLHAMEAFVATEFIPSQDKAAYILIGKTH